MTRDADELIALNEFEAAGVIPFSYADGSCGIRGVDGATAFPSAITLAATFDRSLAEEYGRMLGRELIAAGRNVLLAPALDIARDPRSGRIGESLGEDPLLTGELGGRMGRGIQSNRVLAVAKHYVCNNVERYRTGEGPLLSRTDALDVDVDDRALHEVYLAPFRRAVQQYGVAGLLGSYNRVNGEYVCQSRDLLQLPRREWGFDGVTIPDFLFAVRDADAALRAGLDVAGLEELAGRTREMVRAASDTLIEDVGEHVRAAARRVDLVAPTGSIDERGLGTADALAFAELVASEGAVLLRNEGVLPFAASTRIAVVGAEDLFHRLVVGGAASVTLTPQRIPGLRESLESEGIAVAAEVDGLADISLPTLTAADADLHAVVRRDGEEQQIALDIAELRADAAHPDASWSAELTALLPADEHPLVISAEFAGELELLLDGEPLARGFREASPMVAGPRYVLRALVPASTRPRSLVARYRTGSAIAIPGTPIAPHLVIGARSLRPVIDDALLAAEHADAVVVLAGRVTGEAMDADELALPAGQAQLIDALTAAGRPVVVVTHGAGPIEMPWRHSVAAILHLGHAGERFAPALAGILSGRLEPGGRLPLTIPDGSPHLSTSPDAATRVVYEEGVDVGYRGHEREGIEPAYWFGHGLGYADISLHDARADGAAVVATVSADRGRGGKAVVQMYARAAESDTLKLVGFAVARLHAGEVRTVRLEVDTDALSHRVPGGWRHPDAVVDVHVGFSRGDLRATVEVRP